MQKLLDANHRIELAVSYATVQAIVTRWSFRMLTHRFITTGFICNHQMSAMSPSLEQYLFNPDLPYPDSMTGCRATAALAIFYLHHADHLYAPLAR